MDRSLAQIGDELYALPPQDFTAARDSRAATARTDGDAALARQITALKRPTVVGYLVNLLALTRPDSLAGLLSLAGRMRASATDGATLRDLSTQRRREMDALLSLVSELGTPGLGNPPSRNQLAEVESTLSAALVDERAAALVRSGRVLKALSYGGFGQLGGADDMSAWAPVTTGVRPASASRAAAPAGPASGPTAPRRTGDRAKAEAAATAAQQAEAAGQARRAAQDRVALARTTLDDARATESQLNSSIEDLTAQVEQLKLRIDQTGREARTARQIRLAAEKDLASAERRLARLT